MNYDGNSPYAFYSDAFSYKCRDLNAFQLDLTMKPSAWFKERQKVGYGPEGGFPQTNWPGRFLSDGARLCNQARLERVPLVLQTR